MYIDTHIKKNLVKTMALKGYALITSLMEQKDYMGFIYYIKFILFKSWLYTRFIDLRYNDTHTKG